MRLLLGFWDTPLPSATLTADKSAGATPVKRQQQRFHRAGGAGPSEMRSAVTAVNFTGRSSILEIFLFAFSISGRN